VARAARAAADAPRVYPDPRGETELRTEIAACLAVARGFACTPSQIFITSGFASALAFAVRTLQLSGSSCWTEEPGYPIARRVLVESGIEPVAVTVDAEGLGVSEGIATAPHASMAIVTAGQQAPLGATLSPQRRHALLEWASRSGAWIVEDDYLSELQLRGRAEPALASLDRDGRVLHIGTFSKTISPSLRLGFLVVPPALVPRFTRVVATTALAPAPLIQHAVGEFLRDGHYLRHLRRMKRLYALRRDALAAGLDALSIQHVAAGLAVLLRLPPGLSDVEVARAAHAQGLAPTALSLWYAQPRPEHGGLLLGVTNLREEEVAESCARLRDVISQLEFKLAASPSSRPPA
jgi:GntR family transcriptional regulator/MocR family aminotransferase